MPAIVAIPQVVEELLVQFGDLFPNEPARRHFGYRTAGEVLDFTLSSIAAGESESAAIDLAVFSKVLPRLRGDQDPDLQRALKSASEIADRRSLVRSSEKLRVMQQRLQATGHLPRLGQGQGALARGEANRTAHAASSSRTPGGRGAPST